jgi:hypothetical protein
MPSGTLGIAPVDLDAIERALADVTDWVNFERLSSRVLNFEGFEVDPRGAVRTRDETP